MKRLKQWLSQKWRAGRGRPVAGIILVAAALLLSFPNLGFSPFKSARIELFDKYQKFSPRQPQSQSVVIVEIDEATLGALGQWPWPRNYFAALIDAIGALNPAAIGLDIIMPEPDHASPQAVAESRTDLPEPLRAAMSQAPSNDKLLANSLAGAPIVLGAAGFPFKTFATQDGLRMKAIQVNGADPLSWLNAYPYVLASLPEFQAVAHGQALLSSDPENGVVRRAAILSNLNGTMTPGLSLEMLRIAHGAAAISVDAGVHGVAAANIAQMRIPMQGNGEAWVHFDKFSRERSISALSLLKGEVPPERIAGKMVLVGLTGLGLQDLITTPLGDRRSGVEVHAQLIESFEDGHFLTRPWWLHWVEIVVLLILGALLILVVPNKALPEAGQASQAENAVQLQRRKRLLAHVKNNKTKFVTNLAIVMSVVLTGTGIALFRWGGLLFDASSLLIVLNTILGSLISSNLIENEHQRKKAELALQEQLVKSAQMTGELDAARRIQMLGSQPVAALPVESSIAIAAVLEPALQVGGNFYDFYLLDERRLFFIVGDVSGKGLQASLLTVVAKALAKNIALRGQHNIGTLMRQLNLELSRVNPEKLTVTALAGIADLQEGALELVNAGHHSPLHLGANRHGESVSCAVAPPLCAEAECIYPVEHLQLAAGDTLLLLGDGLCDAKNDQQERYAVSVLDSTTPPAELLAAISAEVHNFVGAAGLSEDLMLLALRWRGA